MRLGAVQGFPIMKDEVKVHEWMIGMPGRIVGHYWGGKVRPDDLTELEGVATVAMMKEFVKNPSIVENEMFHAIRWGVIAYLRSGGLGNMPVHDVRTARAIVEVDGWETMPIEVLEKKIPYQIKDNGVEHLEGSNRRRILRVRDYMLAKHKLPEEYAGNVMSEDAVDAPVRFEEIIEGRLTPVQARLIRGRYKDGKTVRELAKKEKFTFQAAQDHIRKGLMRLREVGWIMRELK